MLHYAGMLTAHVFGDVLLDVADILRASVDEHLLCPREQETGAGSASPQHPVRVDVEKFAQACERIAARLGA